MYKNNNNNNFVGAHNDYYTFILFIYIQLVVSLSV